MTDKDTFQPIGVIGAKILEKLAKKQPKPQWRPSICPDDEQDYEDEARIRDTKEEFDD